MSLAVFLSSPWTSLSLTEKPFITSVQQIVLLCKHQCSFAMFTEAMLFGTSQRLAKVDQFSVSVNGSAIKCVTEFNYLGVIFDEHLSWN